MKIMLSNRLRQRNFKNITNKNLTTNMRIALKMYKKRPINSHFTKCKNTVKYIWNATIAKEYNIK